MLCRNKEKAAGKKAAAAGKKDRNNIFRSLLLFK
jgi:hypothetical protein